MKKEYLFLIISLILFTFVNTEVFAVNTPSTNTDIVKKKTFKSKYFGFLNKKVEEPLKEPEMESIPKDYSNSLEYQSINLKSGEKEEIQEIPEQEVQKKETPEITENTTANEIYKKEKKFIKAAKKKKQQSTVDIESSDIDIDSDTMEYFPETYELVAIGHVVITIKQNATQLFADKIVYNVDLNTIKGYDNVKLVKGNQTIYGDFVNINMNKENILIQKPSVGGNNYKVEAKEGYIYPDKIITKAGNIELSDSTNIVLKAPGTGSDYPLISSPSIEKLKNLPDNLEKNSNFRAKVIYIKSLEDHDEVVIKNVGYYYKDKKLFTIPRIELTTDKGQDFVETNLPEIGSLAQYASYIGPGFVTNIPGGATLKLTPSFQMGRGNSKHDFGFGVLGRFHSKNNLTEVMWGTVSSPVIVRGQHRFGEYLKLQYAHEAYLDDWFMGMRLPEYLIQLVHDRAFYLDDIDTKFRNRLSAGYVSDYYSNMGTIRFRWQTEIAKTLWSKWNEDETIGINAGVIAQTAASLYGSGDFFGTVRGGPFIGTRFKKWDQSLFYFHGAQAGQSPMIFDQYMYGKSNITLSESLNINKYLSIGYLGSLALMKDNWENKMFQENRFYVAVGPENYKVVVGYDPIRSSLNLNYLISLDGAKMRVPYDTMIVDDATTLGKKNKKSKKKKVRQRV